MNARSLRRTGRVIQLTDTHRARVELDDMPACGQCARGRGCGIQLLPVSGSPIAIECDNAVGAEVEQRVEVATAPPDRGWLLHVFWAYGMPLVGLIAGSVVGWAVAQWALWAPPAAAAHRFIGPIALSDLATALGALLGLAGGVFAWNRHSRTLDTRASLGQCLRYARIVGISSSRG